MRAQANVTRRVIAREGGRSSIAEELMINREAAAYWIPAFAGMTIGRGCKSGPLRMRAQANVTRRVIAREGGRSSIAEELMINREAAAYWIPAFAGMTIGRGCKSGRLRMRAQANVTRRVIAREGGRSSIAEELMINREAAAYWIPAFAGMTIGRACKSGPLRMRAQANVTRRVIAREGGRSSSAEELMINREAAAYWIPAFAGMTIGRACKSGPLRMRAQANVTRRVIAREGGRSSSAEELMINREAAAYWIPAFAGMTIGRACKSGPLRMRAQANVTRRVIAREGGRSSIAEELMINREAAAYWIPAFAGMTIGRGCKSGRLRMRAQANVTRRVIAREGGRSSIAEELMINREAAAYWIPAFAGMTIGRACKSGPLRMRAQANVTRRVIAREGGRSSIAEELMINREAAAYWIPAFAGMTIGRACKSGPLRMRAQANVTRRVIAREGGRSSSAEELMINREAAAYWIPAFAGMTIGRACKSGPLRMRAQANVTRRVIAREGGRSSSAEELMINREAAAYWIPAFAGMTIGRGCKSGPLRMRAQANVTRRVIAREGGRSSIAEEPMINREAAAYWIPAFAGMTIGRGCKSGRLRMRAPANVTRRVTAREGGRSSIAEEPMINRQAAAYWIPAFAGMTIGRGCKSARLRMRAQSNVTRRVIAREGGRSSIAEEPM